MHLPVRGQRTRSQVCGLPFWGKGTRDERACANLEVVDCDGEKVEQGRAEEIGWWRKIEGGHCKNMLHGRRLWDIKKSVCMNQFYDEIE